MADPIKLSERLIKWIKAQRCTGVDRGWRYLTVELAQGVETQAERLDILEAARYVSAFTERVGALQAAVDKVAEIARAKAASGTYPWRGVTVAPFLATIEVLLGPLVSKEA